MEKSTARQKNLMIEEKPQIPKSSTSVIGLYSCPNHLTQEGLNATPSEGDELEITSITQMFLDEDYLSADLMGRGYAWFNNGTYQSLFEASSFIEIIENRQGFNIDHFEEIAFFQGFISKKQLLDFALPSFKSQYGQNLISLAESAE